MRWRSSFEVAIDLNGFFGLRPIWPGLSDVKLSVHVQSAAQESTLRELLEATRSLSPVFASVTRPVSVVASIVKITERTLLTGPPYRASALSQV